MEGALTVNGRQPIQSAADERGPKVLPPSASANASATTRSKRHAASLHAHPATGDGAHEDRDPRPVGAYPGQGRWRTPHLHRRSAWWA